MQEIGSCVLSTPCQKQPNDPDCSAKMCTIRGCRSWAYRILSPSSSSRKHHCPRQQSEDARIKAPLAGLFAARPKTYEFRLPTFLTGIASFQDAYLISGWFMGSHRTRERTARRPPSFKYVAGIPLGVPRGEIPGPMEGIRRNDVAPSVFLEKCC